MSIASVRIIIDGLFNQNLKRDEFLLNSNGTWSNNTSYNLANSDELSNVAFTGSYNDLSDKPTIPTVNNATLTIQKNGTNVQTFTANSSTNKTANITVPTKTSDLTNDSGFLTSVPTASTSTLGGIKVGNNLTISSDGTLSANTSSVTVDSALSSTSTNPVQNKVVFQAIDNLNDDKISYGDVETSDIANSAVTTAKIANGAVTSGKIDWTTIPQGATGLSYQNFKGYFDIGNIRIQYMNLKQTGLNTAAYGYNVWQATWPAPFGNDWYCAVANATSDTGNVAGNDLKVTGRTTTTVQINYNHVTAISSSEVYYSVIGIGLKPS